MDGREYDIALTIDLTRDLGVETRPPTELFPRPWSYNVAELINGTGAFSATLETKNPDAMNMRIVTLQNGKWNIKAITSGEIFDIMPNDTAYLVIAYTPHHFQGSTARHYTLQINRF